MKKLRKFLTVFLFFAVAAYALSGCAGTPPSTEYNAEKRAKAENFALLNETAERGQIVMIGDSIVELYPTYELFPNAPLTVYNRDISGDTSDRMLERLETNALKIAPRILSILVGTNDFNRLTREETVGNVRAAVEAAKAAGVETVIVQSLYPVNKSINAGMVGGRNTEELKRYNEAYRAVCGETGAVYADLWGVLADENDAFRAELTYDGLHPNARGYVVLTEALTPYLFSDAA